MAFLNEFQIASPHWPADDFRGVPSRQLSATSGTKPSQQTVIYSLNLILNYVIAASGPGPETGAPHHATRGAAWLELDSVTSGHLLLRRPRSSGLCGRTADVAGSKVGSDRSYERAVGNLRVRTRCRSLKRPSFLLVQIPHRKRLQRDERP
jgi:hypothetical protein